MATAQDRQLTEAFSTSRESSTLQIDNADWAKILDKYVAFDPSGINRFNYAAMTVSDHAQLKKYISNLEKIDPLELNAPEQQAYWINFYNALTVNVVLDHYPIHSIRDIKSGIFTPGPWDRILATVNNHPLTLNNIEHDILRAIWHDPRFHYAVNCASLGCPNLAHVPYSGARLHEQLDEASRDFINHPRAVSVRGKRVTLSKIYTWYSDDFGDGSAPMILDHVAQYADVELKSKLAEDSDIDGYQYDWRLNAPGSTFSLP